MQKFLENGSECQSLVLNDVESLLTLSNETARKCAFEYKKETPAAPIENLFTNACFTAIIADITSNLSHIEPDAVGCLKRHSIPFMNDSVHEIITLSEDGMVEAMKNILRQTA